MLKIIYQRETHRLRKQTYGGWVERIVMEFGKVMYTLLYLKWRREQEPTVEHRELCSVLCGSLNGSGVWGRRDTCICMAESLRCSPETTTTLLMGYIPQYKIKNSKKIVFTILKS